LGGGKQRYFYIFDKDALFLNFSGRGIFLFLRRDAFLKTNWEKGAVLDYF
jgi:hypothetical protein